MPTSFIQVEESKVEACIAELTEKGYIIKVRNKIETKEKNWYSIKVSADTEDELDWVELHWG